MRSRCDPGRRLFRLLCLRVGPAHPRERPPDQVYPAGAALGPASIYSAATEATRAANLSSLSAHVIASAYYEELWHPERVPGLMPGVSGIRAVDRSHASSRSAAVPCNPSPCPHGSGWGRVVLDVTGATCLAAASDSPAGTAAR